MDMRTPPHEVKTLLESEPLKYKINTTIASPSPHVPLPGSDRTRLRRTRRPAREADGASPETAPPDISNPMKPRPSVFHACVGESRRQDPPFEPIKLDEASNRILPPTSHTGLWRKTLLWESLCLAKQQQKTSIQLMTCSFRGSPSHGSSSPEECFSETPVCPRSSLRKGTLVSSLPVATPSWPPYRCGRCHPLRHRWAKG